MSKIDFKAKLMRHSQNRYSQFRMDVGAGFFCFFLVMILSKLISAIKIYIQNYVVVL
jgi:hypothetical protein